MRSNLGGHIAGTGMLINNHDENESYFNKKVHVKLTNDPSSMKDDEFDSLCKSLSGEVTTYFREVKR